MKKILTVLLSALLICTLFTPFASAYLNSTSEQLINSAALSPMYTNYSPLDDLVQEVFAARFTSGMSLYEKVISCYDYLVYNSIYGNSTKTTAIYNSIDNECDYYSSFDRRLVAEAYCFINSKRGSCNDFAASFMVMARALGLEAYVIDGSISWSAGTNSHTWTLVKLGGSYYIFDPQAEWRNYSNNGSVSYSNFCISEYSQTSRYYDREECIAKFNNFSCANNPSGYTPSVTPEENVYSKGTYITNEKMNFRTSYSTAATVITLIPAGTTVTVTDVHGVWGQIVYNGTTGWISLDYSTMLSETPSEEPVVEPEPDETYKTGRYQTDYVMNFRSSINGTVLTLIPKGTILVVTKTQDEWGQATYNGQTGWFSLEYSTYIGSSVITSLTGDVNGDNKIDAADARLVLRHSVNLEMISASRLSNADINADGFINAADARLVLRIATNLPLDL